MSALEKKDFEFFRSQVQALAGITLSDAKQELVQTRLRSRIGVLGFSQFSEYRNLLQRLPLDHPEWQEFINHLTTNKTDWFREPAHFEYLVNEYLPTVKRTMNGKGLKIWSAACSTGEEPYTIAMILETLVTSKLLSTYEILATDIDSDVVAKAKKGIYSKAALSQIPPEYHKKAFTLGTEEISHLMKVKEGLRKRVFFDQLNLNQQPFSVSRGFNVIFCRNVFIYFSKEIIAQVVEALYQAAAPGAVLFIGHSESLQKCSWQYVSPSIYLKGSTP